MYYASNVMDYFGVMSCSKLGLLFTILFLIFRSDLIIVGYRKFSETFYVIPHNACIGCTMVN